MVCSLTPWRLATFGTDFVSASRRMRIIWSSVNRLFLMAPSLSPGSHPLKFQLVRIFPGRPVVRTEVRAQGGIGEQRLPHPLDGFDRMLGRMHADALEHIDHVGVGINSVYTRRRSPEASVFRNRLIAGVRKTHRDRPRPHPAAPPSLRMSLCCERTASNISRARTGNAEA